MSGQFSARDRMGWTPDDHGRRSNALMDIGDERDRHAKLGWTPEHDDRHANSDMIAIAMNPLYLMNFVDLDYDRDDEARRARVRKEAVRAAAVLVALIEKLDREEKVDGA